MFHKNKFILILTFFFNLVLFSTASSQIISSSPASVGDSSVMTELFPLEGVQRITIFQPDVVKQVFDSMVSVKENISVKEQDGIRVIIRTKYGRYWKCLISEITEQPQGTTLDTNYSCMTQMDPLGEPRLIK